MLESGLGHYTWDLVKISIDNKHYKTLRPENGSRLNSFIISGEKSYITYQ